MDFNGAVKSAVYCKQLEFISHLVKKAITALEGYERLKTLENQNNK